MNHMHYAFYLHLREKRAILKNENMAQLIEKNPAVWTLIILASELLNFSVVN